MDVVVTQASNVIIQKLDEVRTIDGGNEALSRKGVGIDGKVRTGAGQFLFRILPFGARNDE